jgi:L-fuculose-phosphate aldolase
VTFGRRLVAAGYVVGADGNLSLRAEGGMLITPSGRPYDRTEPEHIVHVRADGGWEGDIRPSSERAVHAAVYAARADVRAIVHAHPVYSCVLAVRGTALPPLLDEVEPVLGGEVAVAEYVRSGEAALGEAAAQALGARQAVILARHGTVTVGRDLEEAFYRLEVLERAAQVYVLAQT